MSDEKVADLRWFITDAFCAGRYNCECTQDEIDAGEAQCSQYADHIMKACHKMLASLTGDSITVELPKEQKTL